MPTIFPNLLSYLTKRLPAKRKSADDRQLRLERIDDERMQKVLNDDLITDFATFTKCYHVTVTQVIEAEKKLRVSLHCYHYILPCMVK